ncbi:MAG: serine--tRNA ligase [Spirochaetia bacterium]|nr:serine--tRNA ligase [Spirochaetia bacterium]MBR5915459.1 serine--tRNA ligase [Spirochaetia bacterium]MBR5928270.1 serine--tRNA ligase [Spirochaetia bacterium]
MLDIKFIKEHLEQVKKNITDRNMVADADLVVKLYDEKNALQQKLDGLRQQRNENAAKMKGKLEQDVRTALIAEGKKLKDDIAALEKDFEEKDKAFKVAMMDIPNMAHPDAPIGKEDKENLEVKKWGNIPKFDFQPKDHVELCEALDLVDFETATRVSGTKFYYLKNEAVILELALTRYVMDIIMKEGFTPFITPDVAKEEVAAGIGFNPRGEESNIYTVEGTGTCLVGTAEITLGGYFAGKTIDAGKLPIKMAGLSHCFRREAGAAGQFSKGLYRVHQFSKVEMFIYCLPEKSNEMHQYIRSVEEKIFQGLDVPYRVVDTCTGDLGASAYRKYDLEAWMPGRGDYGEITSTSNCTDFQARRLGIKYKDENGTNYLHMLNGTAMALTRAMIAIIENNQQADGSILIPKNLVPYTGFDRIVPKK